VVVLFLCPSTSCLLTSPCVCSFFCATQSFFNFRRKLQIFWLIWLFIITLAASVNTWIMWLTLIVFFLLIFIADLMFLNDSFIYDPTANAQVRVAYICKR
jgi:hypothetical protein